MPFPTEKLRILQTVDRSFDLGTRENFILNNWLLAINLVLIGVFALDVAEYFGYIHGTADLHAFIRDAEIVFGMLFLMEFTLRSVFVYLPDKKFFSFYSIVNLLVIVSLLAPHFIGNLAMLRFLQIYKVYKVYKLKKDRQSYHVDGEQIESGAGRKRRRWPQILMALLVLWMMFFVLLNALFQPSHDRDWELGHGELPHITYVDADQIVIDNYRNFAWTGPKEAGPHYETRTFDLSQLTTADVIISHFSDFEGLAHIFLSFGFTNGEHVVVSLETRRESDEEFSPVLGILRQFEIIYVVGSEEDVVGVRTGHRNERVYLYPTVATPAQARELFERLVLKINDIYDTPRMYNTLTHNCTNELTRPVEQMSTVRFPLTWKTILPGYFDEVLYDLRLIDVSRSFLDTKAAHLIDNAMVSADSSTYSQDIRTTLQ